MARRGEFQSYRGKRGGRGRSKIARDARDTGNAYQPNASEPTGRDKGKERIFNVATDSTARPSCACGSDSCRICMPEHVCRCRLWSCRFCYPDESGDGEPDYYDPYAPSAARDGYGEPGSFVQRQDSLEGASCPQARKSGALQESQEGRNDVAPHPAGTDVRAGRLCDDVLAFAEGLDDCAGRSNGIGVGGPGPIVPAVETDCGNRTLQRDVVAPLGPAGPAQPAQVFGPFGPAFAAGPNIPPHRREHGLLRVPRNLDDAQVAHLSSLVPALRVVPDLRAIKHSHPIAHYSRVGWLRTDAQRLIGRRVLFYGLKPTQCRHAFEGLDLDWHVSMTCLAPGDRARYRYQNDARACRCSLGSCAHFVPDVVVLWDRLYYIAVDRLINRMVLNFGLDLVEQNGVYETVEWHSHHHVFDQARGSMYGSPPEFLYQRHSDGQVTFRETGGRHNDYRHAPCDWLCERSATDGDFSLLWETLRPGPTTELVRFTLVAGQEAGLCPTAPPDWRDPAFYGPIRITKRSHSHMDLAPSSGYYSVGCAVVATTADVVISKDLVAEVSLWAQSLDLSQRDVLASAYTMARSRLRTYDLPVCEQASMLAPCVALGLEHALMQQEAHWDTHVDREDRAAGANAPHHPWYAMFTGRVRGWLRGLGSKVHLTAVRFPGVAAALAFAVWLKAFAGGSKLTFLRTLLDLIPRMRPGMLSHPKRGSCKCPSALCDRWCFKWTCDHWYDWDPQLDCCGSCGVAQPTTWVVSDMDADDCDDYDAGCDPTERLRTAHSPGALPTEWPALLRALCSYILWVWDRVFASADHGRMSGNTGLPFVCVGEEYCCAAEGHPYKAIADDCQLVVPDNFPGPCESKPGPYLTGLGVYSHVGSIDMNCPHNRLKAICGRVLAPRPDCEPGYWAKACTRIVAHYRSVLPMQIATFVCWVSRYPARKQKPRIAAWKALSTTNDCKANAKTRLFVKREIGVRRRGSPHSDHDPRAIQASTANESVLTGPTIWSVAEAIKKNPVDGEIAYYASGWTAEQLDSFVQHGLDQGYDAFLSIDARRLDSSVRRGALKVFPALCAEAGCSEECSDQQEASRDTKGSTEDGIRYAAEERQRSGKDCTTASNTVVVADTVREGLKKPGPGGTATVQGLAAVSGDDVLVMCNRRDLVEVTERILASYRRAGLEPVLAVSDLYAAEFCSGRFWPSANPRGFAYGPKPGKLCAKLCYSADPTKLGRIDRHHLSVMTGLENQVAHVPIARAFVAQMKKLASQTAHSAATGFQAEVAARRASRVTRIAPAAFDRRAIAACADLYGITEREVLEVEQEIYAQEAYPAWLKHPAWERIVKTDVRGAPKTHIVTGHHSPEALAPGALSSASKTAAVEFAASILVGYLLKAMARQAAADTMFASALVTLTGYLEYHAADMLGYIPAVGLVAPLVEELCRSFYPGAYTGLVIWVETGINMAGGLGPAQYLPPALMHLGAYYLHRTGHPFLALGLHTAWNWFAIATQTRDVLYKTTFHWSHKAPQRPPFYKSPASTMRPPIMLLDYAHLPDDVLAIVSAAGNTVDQNNAWIAKLKARDRGTPACAPQLGPVPGFVAARAWRQKSETPMYGKYSADLALNSLADRGALTKPAVEWLKCAIDPFHDTDTYVTGYPDINIYPCVVQVVKKTVTIAKPTSVTTGTWDCNFVSWPAETGYGSAGVNQSSLTLVGNAAITEGTGFPSPVGVTAYAQATGSNTSINGAPSSVQGQLVLDDNYVKGAARVIAKGFEVVNTTAPLNKQGQVIVYRSPVQTRDPEGYYLVTTLSGSPAFQGSFTALDVTTPPLTPAAAMDQPGSRQWDAAEGCYCVATLNNLTIPTTGCNYDLPIVQTDQDEDSEDTAAITVPFAVFGEPAAFLVPPLGYLSCFNVSGAYFTGLSLETTLSVTQIWYVERFPEIADEPDLAVLAKPSPALDSFALECYAHALPKLPPGVMVRENGLGDWFASTVAQIGEFVSPVVKALPIPGSQYISGAISAASAIARNYVSKPAPMMGAPPAAPNTIFPAGKSTQVEQFEYPTIPAYREEYYGDAPMRSTRGRVSMRMPRRRRRAPLRRAPSRLARRGPVRRTRRTRRR